MNSVILVGRLTKDPEVKYVGEKSILVTNFTLAVDRKSKKESKGQKTDFIRIEAWKEAADICANKIKKGNLVSVKGELRIDEYLDKEENRRYSTKITTYNVTLLEHSKKQVNGIDIFEGEKVNMDEAMLPF
ncbi:single-stranded DNA-binding protein [Paraclostridium bifermentans]|jgi:single-strand DNA-binding protein|uniref:Single-stranded DNA-binding protein n=1 Tax=Paraclostridium bifermentans ATCC 638 = DSM 14991 TaxID=1233171 RepID=T4VP85_PARBF|nr:single-stranded DNA-binding protein [Paraclostridium bifermentans]RDC48408.1 single-stranded DNA-binding protein [Acinetobacter sp. RIT592]EQK42477.1 single-stranded DNA-binding family protein [[Clostridium] bifermentans ATCC 638] [Paraclostridium bifermentans ATCC 638 = DSM 14991]MBS5952506.1 single-stranded DNA-binding protein [Paraclostridium bifermentans]MBU5287900.1 single-stranded DNA-binding protein [Paraclostridium bifermentans]MDU3335030.1 single-stranded DNA-binding protein [Parac